MDEELLNREKEMSRREKQLKVKERELHELQRIIEAGEVSKDAKAVATYFRKSVTHSLSNQSKQIEDYHNQANNFQNNLLTAIQKSGFFMQNTKALKDKWMAACKQLKCDPNEKVAWALGYLYFYEFVLCRMDQSPDIRFYDPSISQTNSYLRDVIEKTR